MPCRTIESGVRNGDVYVVDKWARSPSPPPDPSLLEKKERKPLDPKRPRFCGPRFYPDVEFEWPKDYPYGWAGMGGGEFDKQVDRTFMQVNKK